VKQYRMQNFDAESGEKLTDGKARRRTVESGPSSVNNQLPDEIETTLYVNLTIRNAKGRIETLLLDNHN